MDVAEWVNDVSPLWDRLPVHIEVFAQIPSHSYMGLSNPRRFADHSIQEWCFILPFIESYACETSANIAIRLWKWRKRGGGEKGGYLIENARLILSASSKERD